MSYIPTDIEALVVHTFSFRLQSRFLKNLTHEKKQKKPSNAPAVLCGTYRTFQQYVIRTVINRFESIKPGDDMSRLVAFHCISVSIIYHFISFITAVARQADDSGTRRASLLQYFSHYLQYLNYLEIFTLSWKNEFCYVNACNRSKSLP